MAGPRTLPAVVIALPLLLASAGCAPVEDPPATSGTTPAATTGSSSDTPTPDTPAPDPCAPESLQTREAGTLTIATDEPAYEPWFVDNDPTNGKGFEGAVAYAVSRELGFARDEVEWVRVPFNAAIQPGPKQFDFDINEFSITEKRRQAVDFSAPYYDVTQAVIAVKGNPAADAASLADLQALKIGAQVGTTSLDAIEEGIAPEQDAAVFNTNDDAKVALQNGQIDALVTDLPTAFFITAVELDGGVIVGQLPQPEGTPEQFGLVLDKGSALTACVSEAVEALRADGTLADIEERWLAEVADAPVLR